jgi:hypothetical protein
MLDPLLALVIILACLLVIFLLFKRIKAKAKRKVLVGSTTLVVFIVLLLASIPDSPRWVPLGDFIALFGTVRGMGLILVLFIVFFYSIAGFSLGCGFTQVTRVLADRVKLSERTITSKKANEGLLELADVYFTLVVILLAAYALLDVFGVIAAEPATAAMIRAIVATPFAWQVLGLFIFGFRFWRDRHVSRDFSMAKSRAMSTLEHFYFTRLLLIFIFSLGTWIFFLLAFFSGSITTFPSIPIFAAFVALGFNVEKEPRPKPAKQ